MFNTCSGFVGPLNPESYVLNSFVPNPYCPNAFRPNISFFLFTFLINRFFSENSKAPRVRGVFEFAARRRRRKQVSISFFEIETCLRL